MQNHLGRTAIIVVDMLQDSVHGQEHGGIAREARAIIRQVQRLLSFAREKGLPVIYACDSFQEDDFIFTGRMKPHALAGTPGAEVVAELAPQPGEPVVRKRRFSAFFGTALHEVLRDAGVTTVALAGITTHICILATALDALSWDFRVVILADCCAAPRRETHEAVLNLYRHGALYPLLQVATLQDFMSA